MSVVHDPRVVTLVDMDCFYCQVETRLNPELKGKPVAVVQYNQWKGGGIIAVNYEAKAKGVTRGMRGSQAQEICPDINLVSVPVLRGKADLSKYREAGDEVAKIFTQFSSHIQRASIDEAYIDLTKVVNEKIRGGLTFVNETQLKTTYVVGFSDLDKNCEDSRRKGLQEWVKLMNESSPDSSDFQLTVGSIIVEEMREQILKKTGFHCSAGVAHNKVLAKLVAGLHKPKHQTIVPQDGVPELYSSLPIYKIRNLGGKFGKYVMKKLSVEHMSDLYKYSLQELQTMFDEKSGSWLYNIARGIDLEPVTQRLIPESIGCCKNFPGKAMLTTKRDVEHWIGELSDEISERLWKDMEKNKRRAKLLTVSLYQTAPISRSECLSSYDTKSITNLALEILKKFNNASSSTESWEPPIKFLGLSAGKFSKEVLGLDKYLMSTSSRESECFPGNDKVKNETKQPNCHGSIQKQSFSDDATNTKDVSSDEKDLGREQSFFLSFLKNNKNSYAASRGQTEENLYDRPQSSRNVIGQSSAVVSGNVIEVDNMPEMSSSSNDSLNARETETTCDSMKVCDTEFCEECGEKINVIDFFEHLDYHAAVKLQAELNKELNMQPKETNLGKKKTASPQIKNKRKRSEGAKTASKKTKDITSFFKVITK